MKDRSICLRVPPDMDEALRARAGEMGITVPKLCRLALEKFLVPAIPPEMRESLQRQADALVAASITGRPAMVPPLSTGHADVWIPPRPPEIPPRGPEIPSAPVQKVPPAWAVKKQKKVERAAGICPMCKRLCTPLCTCGCHRRER